MKFIGGPVDGQDYATSGNSPYVNVPVARDYLRIDRLTTESRPFDVETYRLEKLQGKDIRFQFYVHQPMPIDTAIHQIISKYGGPTTSGRESFEDYIRGKGMSLSRFFNSDGSPGGYRDPTVQIAWVTYNLGLATKSPI